MWAKVVVGLVAVLMVTVACDESTGSTPPPPTDLLDDDTRFDELVMRCTHNSYHKRPRVLAHPSHDYEHLPLDQQLDAGVRAFELDIHPGTSFPVLHIPLFDKETTCANLGACIDVIADWSERNPTHHMLVVWIETKDDLSSSSITNYPALDTVIRDHTGAQRLYTMHDFMRGASTPREALETHGWPTVGETRGKVMFVLLDVNDRHYDAYRAHASDAQRAMFSRARAADYFEPWALVAKVDSPQNATAIREALDAGLLVASNIGSADRSKEENDAQLLAGLNNGSHMLCDDFPVEQGPGEYWLDIPEFFPTGCNVQTASNSCVPSTLDPVVLD